MQWMRTVLRGALMTVLLLLCAAMFYLLIIMGDTGRTHEETDADMGRAHAVLRAGRPG